MFIGLLMQLLSGLKASMWYLREKKNFFQAGWEPHLGLDLLRNGSAHGFKIVSLSFLVTLATNFDAIF